VSFHLVFLSGSLELVVSSRENVGFTSDFFTSQESVGAVEGPLLTTGFAIEINQPFLEAQRANLVGTPRVAGDLT
jgi:hypothetical protein